MEDRLESTGLREFAFLDLTIFSFFWIFLNFDLIYKIFARLKIIYHKKLFNFL